MRVSELKGLPVIAVDNADKLGTVDDVLIDLNGRTLAGLRISMSGLFAGHKDLAWPDIRAIGSDAVTVQSGDVLKDPKDVIQLSDLPDSGYIDGSKVMTEGGKEIGSVADIEFDQSSGAMTGFRLSTGFLSRLEGESHTVPIASVKSVSKDMVVVTDDVVERAELRS